MSGIEKEVDNLGRVVIPISFRRLLGIEPNSKVLVSIENDVLHISPANKQCALCGKKVPNGQKVRLCNHCISKIKSE